MAVKVVGQPDHPMLMNKKSGRRLKNSLGGVTTTASAGEARSNLHQAPRPYIRKRPDPARATMSLLRWTGELIDSFVGL
jgi:hypothetical protein